LTVAPRIFRAGPRRVGRAQARHNRLRARHGFDEGAGGSRLEGAVDQGLGPVGLIDGRRRQPSARGADDVGLDDDVVRSADQEQVLDIVPAQQNQLPLTIEIVDVDDAESRLAAAPVIGREREPAAGQAAEHESKQRQKHENDREGDHVLDRRGQGFGAWDR
jgi:hypothetical protein